MLEKRWLNANNEPVELITELHKIALASHFPEKLMYIGTDSQSHAKAHEYVTCVVILTPGKGGRYFYHREKERKHPSLQEKLFKEVYLSCEIATEVAGLFPNWTVEVHIDANTNIKHKSAKYAQSLAGLVAGHGFRPQLKPEAWCASHVSEHLVKYRHIKD